MRNFFICMFIGALLFSCQEENTEPVNNLKKALASQNPKIKKVMDDPARFEVQIKYSRVLRNGDSISFEDYDFQIDSTTYFYPASTVKFPIAILALAKLNSYDSLNRKTRFYIEGDTVITTFENEIEKIFAVSDNDAYNRLFEFLGQDYINETLLKGNIGPLRISHRLSVEDAADITTKPLIVYLNDSTTTVLKESFNSIAKPVQLKKISKGVGYMAGGKLISEPFDFSLKNYYPLETQHQFLKTVLFPELYAEKDRIVLSNEQSQFVRKTMRTVPRKLGYDPETYYDGYCKFFIYGDTKENIPEYMHYYNKVGNAYGTLVDCAYINDTKNNVEFLLTATILVNGNGVFNDNNYQYDDIGFPFFAELGREIYSLQLTKNKPL